MWSIRQIGMWIAACCVVGPLFGQLDPRLVMLTDTLDGQRKNMQAKPEAIMILDFSGSMSAMTRHRVAPDAGEDEARITFKTSDASTAISLGSFTGQLDANTAAGTYEIRVKEPIAAASGGVGGRGPLVTPDGVLVSDYLKGLIQASSGGLLFPEFYRSRSISGTTVTFDPDHQWWVRQASHARITASGKTIDVPVPWRIMGVSSNKEYDAYVIDPKLGTKITYDYTEPDPTAHKNYEIWQTGVQKTGGTIGGVSQMANTPGLSTFSYQVSYYNWLFQTTNVDFKVDLAKVDPEEGKKGMYNKIPPHSRAQAVKVAVFKVWAKAQDEAHFAYRFLAYGQEGTSISGNNEVGGTNDRSLRLLSGFTGPAPKTFTDLQKKQPYGGTPLTYALANTYGQMMNGAVFAEAEKEENSKFQQNCRKHYVILFTDGIPNDNLPFCPGKGDPFGARTELGDWIVNLKSNLDPGNANCNIYTLAGMAAHGSQVKDPSNPDSGQWVSSTTSSGTVEACAPFGVSSRPNLQPFKPHRVIETMTVGMSLGAEGKTPLLKAAGYGQANGFSFVKESKQPSWNQARFKEWFEYEGLMTAYEEYLADPKNKPVAEDPAIKWDKVRYFDTKGTDSLVKALLIIFTTMGQEPSSVAAPSAPVAGLKTGAMTYYTIYEPAGKLPYWAGDLRMAGLGEMNGKPILTGKNGDPLNKDHSNAIWSARSILNATQPDSRKIFTYVLPKDLGDSSKNRHELLNLDLNAQNMLYSEKNSELVSYIGGSSDAAASEIRWMRGSRINSDGTSSSRMGDIINSSPVSMEYNISLLGPSGIEPYKQPGERFRVIFVGTNHGFLHAFGETSYPVYKKGKLSHYEAKAKELWSFIPKEFAKGVKAQLTSDNPHVFMVDGPILGYLNESHSTHGTALLVDEPNGTTIQDKAMIVFGLGKGGRSLYALDVTNPASPKLAWAVIPDDEKTGTINPTIGSMGMSVAMPAVGRIMDTANKKLRDVVFVGGGLSTDEIDAKFSRSISYARGGKLGRSIQAFDVQTGEIYQSWDFLNDPSLAAFSKMGSVPAAPVPFDVLGSYTTQRVYFADRSGGVYALGCGERQVVDQWNPGFRVDRSDPKQWTRDGVLGGTLSVRKIWQAGLGEVITTSPRPFLVDFPGKAAQEGKAPPSAVGVAVGTGDYWDPMDRDVLNPDGGKKGRNTFAVLFDRRDSAAMNYDETGIRPDRIFELTETTPLDVVDGVDKGKYFLTNYDGFMVRLNEGTLKPVRSYGIEGSSYYYEKLLTDPFVMKGRKGRPFWTLWLNIFNPDAPSEDIFGSNTWSCGGGGQTITYRIHDVLHPKWSRKWLPTDDKGMDSGMLFEFRGIAGRISATGPNTIAVPGILVRDRGVVTSTPTAGGISMGIDGVPRSGPAVTPRSWRIVR